MTSVLFQDTIAHLKRESHAHTYASPMSPPVARQIIASLTMISSTEEGKGRLRQLAENTRFVFCLFVRFVIIHVMYYYGVVI